MVLWVLLFLLLLALSCSLSKTQFLSSLFRNGDRGSWLWRWWPMPQWSRSLSPRATLRNHHVCSATAQQCVFTYKQNSLSALRRVLNEIGLPFQMCLTPKMLKSLVLSTLLSYQTHPKWKRDPLQSTFGLLRYNPPLLLTVLGATWFGVTFRWILKALTTFGRSSNCSSILDYKDSILDWWQF